MKSELVQLTKPMPAPLEVPPLLPPLVGVYAMFDELPSELSPAMSMLPPAATGVPP